MLTWFNLLLLTLVVFNTTFSTTLLIKYYNVAVENTSILEKLLFERQTAAAAERNLPDPDSESELMFGSLKAKLFDSTRDCPPCPTTEPPTEVIVNKDPVSVLNTEFGPLATYDCVYACKVPPIHIATVHIEDHEKTYTGQARTKQAAKHEAAYKAIKEGFPHLLEQVVYEVVIYNPGCTDLDRGNWTDVNESIRIASKC